MPDVMDEVFAAAKKPGYRKPPTTLDQIRDILTLHDSLIAQFLATDPKDYEAEQRERLHYEEALDDGHEIFAKECEEAAAVLKETGSRLHRIFTDCFGPACDISNEVDNAIDNLAHDLTRCAAKARKLERCVPSSYNPDFRCDMAREDRGEAA